ncbi:hypothetical protein CSA57_10225 [candidate division KSB3 bacterium]|nr:MAG: hypothetical protein CSA57_10225 [candidate division KSB3 bacterium]
MFVVMLCALSLLGLNACVQTLPDRGIARHSALSNHEPHRLLQKHLAFSDEELRKMEEGGIIAKTFDSSVVANEVAAFGIMRINIPKELYLEQFRDIVTFTKSPEIKVLKKFSDPPTLKDLSALKLIPVDLHALKSCRPNACKVKIDDSMMLRFQKEVAWGTPAAREQAETLMREFMLEYLNGYLQDGDAALGEYHDKKQPLRIADAFGELLDNSAFLFDYAPELYNYLKHYPNSQLDNVENFFYWSEEQYGLKPVLNLFHISIYQRRRGDSNDIFITSKQIYASHYFESSLGFTAFVDEQGGQEDSNSYLMYLNRSRFDQLRGPLKAMMISLARQRVHDGVERYFTMVKKRLEAAQSRK